MSIYETHTYIVVCDGPGCSQEASDASSESLAQEFAREKEWLEVDGKWYCCEGCKTRGGEDGR
jgi:hypothetical protein